MVFDITKLNYICNKEHVISNFETNKIKVSRPELPLQSYWLLNTMMILLANFLYRQFFAVFVKHAIIFLALKSVCR